MKIVNEEWQQIEGYEKLYLVSSFGRVQKLNPVKLLSPTVTKRGYAVIRLRANGEVETKQIHRLVAKAFIPNPNKYRYVLHGAAGISDNSVANLQWGTQSQNNIDRQRDGTDANLNKEVCPRKHKYSGYNLIVKKSATRRPYRSCRACNTARAHLRNNPDDLRALKTISDAYYQKYQQQQS